MLILYLMLATFVAVIGCDDLSDLNLFFSFLFSDLNLKLVCCC